VPLWPVTFKLAFFYILLYSFRIYLAAKALRHKEKNDINKIIHMWPGYFYNINTPNIKQDH